MYPSARSGGNYMHNYYFPMAPSSTPHATPDQLRDALGACHELV